jgi:acid phosphatase family membrane protein YuiD
LLSDLASNKILLIALCSWAIAQIFKVIVILFQEKRIAWNYFFTSGGMPSAHTATVCALATSTAMIEGMGSIVFGITAVLAVIVMYDAAGVRQSVGQHSAILNLIVKEMSTKLTKLEREKDFREFIGHTPFQVLIGALLGILVAWTWVTLSTL